MASSFIIEGDLARVELPPRMLLSTLYMPRGMDLSREYSWLERDEHLDRSLARRLLLVGRENWGDLGGFGSMGRLK